MVYFVQAVQQGIETLLKLLTFHPQPSEEGAVEWLKI